MNGRWILLCSLLALLMAAFGAAQAGDNDPNICNGSWAGQCTTQRDWEAGWCYANVAEATCDTLYGDVRSSMHGAPVSTTTSGAGVASAQFGAQAQGQAQQQQNCTPSISFAGLNSGTYSFSVNKCGKSLAALPNTGTLKNPNAGNNNKPLGGASYNVSYGPDFTYQAECYVRLFHQTDANGNEINNQLYWNIDSASTHCNSSNVSVS